MIILILVFDGDNFIPEYEGNEDKYFTITIKGVKKPALNFKFSDSFALPSGGFNCPDYKNYCSIMASGRLKHPNGKDDY